MTINLNGYFEDKIHCYPQRIHYADTDAGGVVYHSRYLELAERARAAVLNAINVPEVAKIENKTYFWVVRRAKIDYKAPAKVMDIVVIKSAITKVNSASLEVAQSFICDGKSLVELQLLLAFVSEEGKVQKIMPEIRHKMLPYIQLSTKEGKTHG